VAAQLFPPIQPRRTGFLPVDALHTLYWEELGAADGVPIVVLHGGPGAAAPPSYRRHFDPRFYRMIFFDQRGAGRSTPLGETRDNSTRHLVADVEAVRRHLGVERWVVAGASWGSTLGLAYGLRHPDRCLGFLLRGIFLGDQSEIDWFLYGIETVFPEAWRAFAEHVPPKDRADLLGAYHRLVNAEEPATRLAAATAWSVYEGACSSLLPQSDVTRTFADPALALGLARLETHYFINRAFLEPGELLAGLPAVTAKPAVIVQGRYDMICPIRTADRLARAWPGARYHIVPDGGHSGLDPAITVAQIEAGEALKAPMAQHRGG
jgi:proline iminopeptidase